MTNDEMQLRKTKYISRKTNELMLVYDIDRNAQKQIPDDTVNPLWTVNCRVVSRPERLMREALWLEEHVWGPLNALYSKKILHSGRHTGAEFFRQYLTDLKYIFEEDPRYYVLDAEVKAYFRRYTDAFWKDYKQHLDMEGCPRVVEEIYLVGKEDQSMEQMPDPSAEAEFFCRAYFGFLCRMARMYEYQPKEAMKQIDQYIEQVMHLYATGRAA
jgi:hypothetical protein